MSADVGAPSREREVLHYHDASLIALVGNPLAVGIVIIALLSHVTGVDPLW